MGRHRLAWIIALLLFLLAAGDAVIELAHSFPGDGGVIGWARGRVSETFTDFYPAGVTGTHNRCITDPVMLILRGVSVMRGGRGMPTLGPNK